MLRMTALSTDCIYHLYTMYIEVYSYIYNDTHDIYHEHHDISNIPVYTTYITMYIEVYTSIYQDTLDIYHEHHGISRLILMLWYMHCISLGNFNVER